MTEAGVPWRMCRTCHRIGADYFHRKDRKHAVGDPGICGQCWHLRPLVECHQYDFRRTRLASFEDAAVTFLAGYPTAISPTESTPNG